MNQQPEVKAMQAMRIPRERPPRVRPPNCNLVKGNRPNSHPGNREGCYEAVSSSSFKAHSGFYNPAQKLFPLVGELLNSTILFKPVRLATPGKTTEK